MDSKATDYLMRAQEARKAAAEARYAELREGFLKVAEEWERMAGQHAQGPPNSPSGTQRI